MCSKYIFPVRVDTRAAANGFERGDKVSERRRAFIEAMPGSQVPILFETEDLGTVAKRTELAQWGTRSSLVQAFHPKVPTITVRAETVATSEFTRETLRFASLHPYLSAVEPSSQAPAPFDITGTLVASTGRVHEATNGELLETNIRPATVNPANPVRSGRLAGVEGRTGTARPGTTNQSLLWGKTVHDAARGLSLGFPTANLSQVTSGQVLADSIYAGWLTDEAGVRWPAAISTGSNPTFNGLTRQIEAHVIGRPREAAESFNLCGQTVVLEFVARLGGTISFPDSRTLIEEMHTDVEHARTILVSAEH